MKKERRNPDKAIFYLFLILFFGWILTQFILINQDRLIINNKITGLAQFDVGTSISNSLSLLENIFNPIVGGISNDSNAVFLRLMYGLILFWIISIPLKKVLPDERESKINRSSAVALIISLISAALVPAEFLLTLSESLFLFVVIGVIFGGLYFIYNFSRDRENRFIYLMKGVFSLVLFVLIGTASGYAKTKLNATGVAMELVIAIGLLISSIFFIWYLFVKSIAGGTAVAEPKIGSAPIESLKRAGGAYGGLGGLFRRRQNLQQPQVPQQEAQQQAFGGNIKQNLLRNYYMPMQMAHQNIVREVNNANPNLNTINQNLSVIRDRSRGIIATLGNSPLTGAIVTQVTSLARSINTNSTRMMGIKNARQLSINYRRGNSMQNWMQNLQRAINNL